MGVIIKSAAEIDKMRQAGEIVARVLAKLVAATGPGVKTMELDKIAVKEVEALGARPSFLGYRGYPASVCVSVNDEIVHGIPGDRKLKEGDIVSLDFGAIYNGYHGDAAVTVGIGEIIPEAARLLEATGASLSAGVAAAREGACLGDVSAAIQASAEGSGYSVVREYTGHGIGREMHEEPQVLNYGLPGTGPVLKEGMTLCLEPMLNAGGWQTRVAPDKWTVLTADGRLSAHFEHAIAITDGAAEVLTRSG